MPFRASPEASPERKQAIEHEKMELTVMADEFTKRREERAETKVVAAPEVSSATPVKSKF